MKEFGSDFHTISSYQSGRAHLQDIYPVTTFLADGRMGMQVLLEQYGWKRIWMPEYFCYEVIESIRQQCKTQIRFYKDYPSSDDEAAVSEIPFKEGDVLFRVNYFGMREKRSEKNIPVPVIEDHTNDLLGRWAMFSDADWCIASLRKTLPIPEGGMVWSPRGHKLTTELMDTQENEQKATLRWQAMDMKAEYIAGGEVDKDAFRKLYLETEEWFDTASSVSLIDKRSKEFLEGFDINAWYVAKKKNIAAISQLLKGETIAAEDSSCNLFSFVVKTSKRDKVRKALLDDNVYPAILWNMPKEVSEEVKNFSETMMSIHCDGRYTKQDMEELAAKINKAL